jgi:hypothetical protein
MNPRLILYKHGYFYDIRDNSCSESYTLLSV